MEKIVKELGVEIKLKEMKRLKTGEGNKGDMV